VKKAIIIILAIVLVIGVLLGLFVIGANQMVKNVKAEYEKVSKVDLNKLADGIYPGSFKEMLVAADLEVMIKNHRIAGITIKKQISGKGYEAKGLTDRIIEAQSPKVDVITGATGSSKCLMIAVNRALIGK
jgi:uncharacterized protein with FMN-binding domain